MQAVTHAARISAAGTFLTTVRKGMKLRGMAAESLTAPLEAINIIVQIALDEDAARHDRTTQLLPEETVVDGAIIARQRAVVCGIDAVAAAFGPSVRIATSVPDGNVVASGTEVAAFSGSARAILSAERTVLNVLGRLSGIATLTRKYVDKLDPKSRTEILDTRKTTPGLRLLEKYAVRCGGGHNHRMTLADMVFIKDNHIAAARDVRKLLANRNPKDYLIIEVESLDQLKEILPLKPDRVLLDNFSDADVAEAMKVVGKKKRPEIEVSGGISPDRIAGLSRLGVDYISVGALTHSAPAANFSLELRR